MILTRGLLVPSPSEKDVCYKFLVLAKFMHSISNVLLIVIPRRKIGVH